MRRRALLAAPLLVLALLAGATPAAAGTVTFDDTPRVMWGIGEAKVRAVLVVNGVLYVGGNFSTVRNENNIVRAQRAGLAAFDLATGQLLTSFQADTNGTVRALASDGMRLYVGGEFTTIGGVARSRLAAVDLLTGDVVGAFRADASGSVYALKPVNGSLYVGGKFNKIDGKARRKLAKLDAATGTVDMAFSPKPDKEVYSLDLTADGTALYAGGAFTLVAGQPRSFLAQVDPATGAAVGPSFASPGRVLDLDVSDDGSALFTATIDQDNSARRWDPATGAAVWRFRVGGNVQAVKAVGDILYLGHHDQYQGNTLRKMEAVDAATGVLDPAFLPDINTYDGVWDITAYSDASGGGLVAGGTFNTVNGVKARRVAVFPPLP